MIRIGVIGYGYWGPNLVRNFSRIPAVSVSHICDVNPHALSDIPRMYPSIHVTTKVSDVMKNTDIDAVIIATPPSTHFPLAKHAFTAGKHVLVEKPMTQTVTEARQLVTLAHKEKRILMVDHTFIYTPAIQKLKAIITSGTLGTIYYVDSVRTNLGIVQKDSNVIWDLATHDFSILDYLFGITPESITATGIIQKDIRQETVAHITANYHNTLFLHCHVSWLSPIKIRRMIFVGTKKMCVYDDIEPTEKLKIYDKGVSLIRDPKRSYQLRIGYRSGSVTAPHIRMEEGLFGMAQEFVQSIQKKRIPLTDGRQGLRVVAAVSSATQSARSRKTLIPQL